MKTRPYFWLTVNWIAVALVLVAAYFVCYSIPLSSMAPDPSLARLHVVSRTIGVFLLVLSGLSAVLLVVVSVATLRDTTVHARYLIWVFLASLSPFFGYVIISLMTWPVHRRALEGVAERGVVLANAVEEYIKEHGEPPASLESLSVTRSTGLAAYPDFTYARFDRAASQRDLYWYDLGRRHGRSIASSWLYPDGDTSNAILVLEVDGNGIILTAIEDRVAVEPKPRAFSTDAWNATPIDRQGLVADLQARHPLVKTAFTDVQALLGPPNGKRIVIDTPWELSAHSWPSEHERFFYWPTHAYPKVMDGQSVLAVSGWAYARD
ncbi:MAG: hypothetical protein H7Z43_01755 [Clostridia bacterium]|nr:hypothetical protein [Deltaproteobacteria bacterium]